ncbi:MAG: hypothetical protein KBD24_00570 [Candidatus Pacebacteria bacterium]|nr:hypothetical protein [Candidatus Paceibacterota bacterium]
MNEQPIQKSERIASQIMRVLAITGLIALLALVAWLIVQGARHIPNAGSSMSAAVSSVTSLFRPAPEEKIGFDLATRTWTEGVQTDIRWTYDGRHAETPLSFSYTCSNDVSLRILIDNTWKDMECGNAFLVTGTALTVTPLSPKMRFADVQISIARGMIEDTTYVTIVNTNRPLESGAPIETIATTTPSTTGTTTDSTPAKNSQPVAVVTTATPTSVAPTPIKTATQKPAPAPVVPLPVVRTPADLAVNIEDTGVYLDVAGRDTFFPISPIPNDKRAAVVFTVTNRGQEESGMWGFVANLPIEGDPKYRYTSPLQTSLAPGMQVEFTLGFDNVVDAKTGAVRIEIFPANKRDSTGNNIDATIVKFK